jgi:hypothetical protein
MTPEQTDHVRRIDRQMSRRLHVKYAKGASEHGGNIWDLTAMELLDNAIDEAADQIVYLSTLRDKLAESGSGSDR